MSGAATSLLERLRAWPDLWRHPAVFALVHGSAETPPSPPDLLAALLKVEPIDRHAEAWKIIVRHDDMAAAQAASNVLASGVSTGELEAARRAFERRADRIRARVEPLVGTLRGEVRDKVDAAVAAVADDPVAAERALARADAQARASEATALAALMHDASADSDSDHSDPRRARLMAALAAGDLRSALILAGPLGISLAPAAASPRYDPWIERQSTINLLNWCRDPSLAPGARLSPATLTDHEHSLLDRLADALTTRGDVDQAGAGQILHLAVRSLAGVGRPAVAIVPSAGGGSDLWAFSVVGPEAARLFPHAADADGVAVVVPRRPVPHFPLGPQNRRFVAFDLFEEWARLARADSIVLTPRMLVRILAASPSSYDALTGRAQAFVRLQSAAIAVQPLLCDIVGGDEARLLRFADVPPQPTPTLAAVIRPLVHALDLDVDEGDLAALAYACGGQISLLVRILPVLGEALARKLPSDRRFDVVGMLLREEVEERIKELIKADLHCRIAEERWANIVSVLRDAATLLEDHSLEDGPSLPADELATALFDVGSASSPAQGQARIIELLSLGLLRNDRNQGGSIESSGVLRTLGLPGRILLRIDD
jgi:hypothetical protein